MLIVDTSFSKEVLTTYSSLENESEKLAYLKNKADSFQDQKVWFWLHNYKFQKSSNAVGYYMGTYGLSSMVFALILVFYTNRRRINRKFTHMVSLILGGIGFLIMYFIPLPNYLHISYTYWVCMGSILSMPYAMLSSSIDPKKMGVIMGIFNMFIVIPKQLLLLVELILFLTFGEELFTL